MTIVSAGLLVVALLVLLADVILRVTVFGGDPHPVSQQEILVLLSAGGFETLYLVLHVPLVAAYVWWRSETRRVLYLFDRSASLTRHPVLVAFWVLLAVGGVLQVASGTLTEPGVETYADPPPTLQAYALTADQHAVAMGMRVLAFALLIAGVWLVRRRIVHSSGAPAPVALVAQVEAAPSVDPVPAADEAFWTRVAAAVPVSLLVSNAVGGSAWRIVTAENLAAVRADLSPGAWLTAFPDAGTLEPARADEYHGLLQRSAEAAPAYRLVLPSRMQAFVAEARTAHRAALYPATDAAALRAQVAQPNPAG